MLRFEEARARHAALIASCMRERDVAEVVAGWLKLPEDAIRHALKHSYYARTCWFDLQPLAMFGLSPVSVLARSSQIWIFGTRHIDTHKLTFIKACRIAMPELYHRAERITNFIDIEDEPANRWLMWLGGKYLEQKPRRYGRHQFKQFVLEAPCRRG